MQIPKPTELDKARFRALVPDDPRVEVKPVFGNLGAFVNGNMFMGLFGASIGLKLNPADAAALAQLEGSGPFGPAERPMAGYVSLPPGMIEAAGANGWVGRSLAFVASRPAKPSGKR
ncbi:MAG TPA: TfoX/Sxy family protein [Candidatus Limnocylindrales bacterium]|nr:TfoX/Sxy family protein [Candidatus Limnocylindrales bacterium]